MTPGPTDPQKDFVSAPDPRARRSKVSFGQVWSKIRVPFLLVVLLALGVVSLLLYTSDRRSTRQAELVVSPEQAEALRQRSLQLEAAFEKIRVERFELREEDIALLEEAQRLLEEYIIARQSIGTDNVRQQALRRRIHLIRGERLRQASEKAEAQALALAKTDEAAAVPFLREALACEQEIVRSWEFSGLADPGRVARLDVRLRRLESAPAWQKGRDLEAEAEKLFAAGKFSAAAAKFDEAIAAETDFLALYRDVRNTEFGRSEKLAVRRATALSGEAWNAILALRAKAEAFEKTGEWPAATQAWQATVDAFTQLLADHPKSGFADRGQEAAIATRLNYARFHEEIVALRARRDQMRAALRERRAEEALRLAEDAVAAARRLGAANAGVFLSGDDEREELEYLAANAATVRGVLPRIDQALRPMTASTARLYHTEIPQGLYASVMGSNPSSTRREANPVESVTYAEAEQFAGRMGWILGAKVRLPTVAEFTAAAGNLDKPFPPTQAWTAANTDGATVHPVGTSQPDANGVHDLIGNVEEWAQAAPGEPRAPVLGGSILSPPAPGLPAKSVFKREKNRALGFRIVIE